MANWVGISLKVVGSNPVKLYKYEENLVAEFEL